MRHYEITAVVAVDGDLNKDQLDEILKESGDIESVERISIRELET